MPISNRPSLEAFINKGGSSTAAEDVFEEKKPAAKAAVEKAAAADSPQKATPKKIVEKSSAKPVEKIVAPVPKAEKAAPKIAAQKMPAEAPAKQLGRPRKVRLPDEADTLKFVMRIPPDISEELNRVVESRRIPISRNAWILEAIVQRIERERGALA